MPIIEVYLPESALDDGRREALHERISRAALEGEGLSWESDLARSLTWVLIQEMPRGTFSTGGQRLGDADRPRVLVRVTVAVGAATDDSRAAIAAGINHALVATLGEEFSDPRKSMCVIEEQPVAGGANIVSYPDLRRILADLSAQPAPDGGGQGQRRTA